MFYCMFYFTYDRSFTYELSATFPECDRRTDRSHIISGCIDCYATAPVKDSLAFMQMMSEVKDRNCIVCLLTLKFRVNAYSKTSRIAV